LDLGAGAAARRGHRRGNQHRSRAARQLGLGHALPSPKRFDTATGTLRLRAGRPGGAPPAHSDRKHPARS
jgi:hypothetical protein